MAPESNTPATDILNLDDLTDRSVVVIDQTEYELRNPLFLAPIQRQRMNRLMLRSDALAEKVELTDVEERELLSIPREQCRLVLKAPAEVLAALDEDQVQAVMNAFFFEAPTLPKRQETGRYRRRLSGGTNGSRGSSAPTQA